MLIFQIIAAGAWFLIAVLWFDLMFDVQVLRHRKEAQVSEGVLESIAAYYHRVTTTASPMGRLVALVMAVLLVALIVQAVREDVEVWVTAVSSWPRRLASGWRECAGVRSARRLGYRTDPRDAQSVLARSIFRDHLVCLAAMVTLLVVQLAGA